MDLDCQPESAEERARQELRDAGSDLEWPLLTRTIAAACFSERARARLSERMPAVSPAEARALAGRTELALAALARGTPVQGRFVPELEATLARVERGGRLGGEELRDIGRLLGAARELRLEARAFASDVTLAPLAALLTSDPALDALEAAIVRAIDERGAVRDDASATLRSARLRVGRLREELGDRATTLSREHADVLRDTGYVERDGRYALAVRHDAHRRIDGIVLGASASGGTIYVEPPALTALGNRLALAGLEVEQEIERVLEELSARTRAAAAALASAYDACTLADELAAITSFARATRAIALVPDDEPRLDLVRMRHPLLALSGEVVANDLTIEAGEALVISGPNAGGKTVALKCLGLAAWMVRAGLPVPTAEGSRAGFLSPVFTAMGDEQSLERSLSTFSAELANLRGILARAAPFALVLVDELCGSTDPEEGAALAAAVLEALVEQGAAVVVTTHYERLKELAAERPGFVNASVGFDVEHLVPTFRLVRGTPGASSALAAAQRFGLPDDVVARARALLPAEGRRREELLLALERERQALAKERVELEANAARARDLVDELERERKTVRDKERERLRREGAALSAKVQEARAKLREAGEQSPRDKKKSEALIDEAARLVGPRGPLWEGRAPEAAGPPEEAALRAGVKVWVEPWGAAGEVVEPPVRGQVQVRAGNMALKVPLSALRPLSQDKRPRAAVAAREPKKHAPRPEPPPVTGPLLRSSDNTLDVRGQRVEEALAELDRFIDRLARAGERDGFVLHGHGTGALKRAVREHLALSGRVGEPRPAEMGEGGDAFTVFRVER
jgi:DNA mismatch repair protein MutS2